MEIIVPCAGLSTRFPNLRPKYLLADYTGKLMIELAVQNYIGKYPITVIVLKEHDIKFNATARLTERFGDSVKIVVLENKTNGPADTIYQALVSTGITGEILVKDCDGFYDSSYVSGNAIYVSQLSKNPSIRNASAKSFVITNEQGIITTVVEKQIVSNDFCVGGYQFSSAELYKSTFEKIKSDTRENFVSNIVDYLSANGEVFVKNEVENFIDVGTAEDWFEYNDKPTYFCDIDGTIIKSAEIYSLDVEPLVNNVNKLLKEAERGCKLVFCTARAKKYKDLTKDMLEQLGFKNFELIMEVHHSKRVLINDYANSNPYPTALALNIKRDDDNLSELITF